MNLKEEYTDFLQASEGNSGLGLKRAPERFAVRWWSFPRDALMNAEGIVRAAVADALDFAQARLDKALEDTRAELEATRGLQRAHDRALVAMQMLQAMNRDQDAVIGKLRAELEEARSALKSQRAYNDNQDAVIGKLRAELADLRVPIRERFASLHSEAVKTTREAAASRGGQHEMGQDQAQERARDLGEVRRRGVSPELRTLVLGPAQAPASEAEVPIKSWYLPPFTVKTSTYQAGRPFRLDANAEMLDIVEKHGIDAFNCALRVAKYAPCFRMPPEDKNKVGRVACLDSVSGCRRVLHLSMPHGWDDRLATGAFVDFYDDASRVRRNNAPARIVSHGGGARLGGRWVEVEFWNVSDAHSLYGGDRLYIAP